MKEHLAFISDILKHFLHIIEKFSCQRFYESPFFQPMFGQFPKLRQKSFYCGAENKWFLKSKTLTTFRVIFR